MPYKVYGGLRFFERAEVKHALSYLRLIENPNDDTSFLRVVNFPTRGIGARSIEQLQDAARQSGRSLYQSVGALSGKGGNNLQAFVALDRRDARATRGLTLREIIEHMLHASGLIDFYKTDKEGADRLENLEELVNAAEAFVTQEGFGKDAVALPVDEHAGALSEGDPPAVAAVDLTPDAETGEIMSPLAAFLTHAVARGRRQPGAGRAGRDPADDRALGQGPGVRLRLHHRPRRGPVPARELVSDVDGLEEERRLMYVAITRARKRLYLSFSQTRMLHGQTRYNVKSRFFDELPESALRWITPRNQGFGSGFAREYQRPGSAARASSRWWARAHSRRPCRKAWRPRWPPPTAWRCAPASRCSTPSSARA
jgi:DNA helicase-2/ATP-dependent DNA helicase PcrA